MAGTFTHWMVAEEAVRKFKGSTTTKTLLQNNLNFVLCGAVAPDMPYLRNPIFHTFIKTHSWGDRMHYEKSGDFVIHGVKNLGDKNAPDYSILYSWLFGYVSHIIADTVVHPVVNATVGGTYRFKADEHRHCELVQDSMIFNAMKNDDITKSSYHHFMEQVSEKPAQGNNINLNICELKDVVNKYWLKTLKDNHPDAGSLAKEDVNGWFKSFRANMGGAAEPIPPFRHLLETQYLAYQSPGDIQDKDKEYYVKAQIPGGGQYSFDKVFRMAVEQTAQTWDKLEDDIANETPDNIRAYIRNWDLDLGLDMEYFALWA
ncbi:MAG: zinc dependent phospholipase C family protein [Nitrospinota bacterium]|nr:zinc dependent phospholipase C family protein [Nitrospinota bacterium]